MAANNEALPVLEKRSTPSVRILVGIMITAMLLSFVFGVAMFIPEEHRAQKLEETMAKYQARKRNL